MRAARALSVLGTAATITTLPACTASGQYGGSRPSPPPFAPAGYTFKPSPTPVPLQGLPPLWTRTVQAQPWTPSADAGIVLVPGPDGTAAIDAENGRTLWTDATAVDDGTVASGIAYLVRRRNGGGPSDGTLIAHDARSGKILWTREKIGGPLAATADGVVAGAWDDVTEFSRDGRKRWSVAGVGHATRIVVARRYVLVLAVQSGATMAGTLATIDRSTGTAVSFDDEQGRKTDEISGFGFGVLGDLHDGHALAASDFMGEMTEACTHAEVLDVAYARMTVASTTYTISSPEPRSSPCSASGDFGAMPRVVFAHDAVILATRSAIHVFDRNRPSAPRDTVRGAAYVGGPFHGYLFVQRAGIGLDAFDIAKPHGSVMHVEPTGTAFALAGFGSRLYVAAASGIDAFDVAHLAHSPIARYAVRCMQLEAIARVDSADILDCGNFAAHRVVALKR